MKCTACGTDNLENAQFCGECGRKQYQPATSSIGLESAELTKTEDRRQLGPDEHFCNSCGEIIKKAAEICPKCGVRLRDAAYREGTSRRSSWILTVPILSLVLGILGLFTFFDDSGWDVETALGCLGLFGIPSIVLGCVSVAKNFQPKYLGISGLILGCINSAAYVAIMASI